MPWEQEGGILLSCNDNNFTLINTLYGTFCLTVYLRRNEDKKVLALIGIYGPSWTAAREVFFEELREHNLNDDMLWMLCGDFNTTLNIEDRSNQQQSWSENLRFASVISELNLMNLNLQGRRFTWLNARENPTMVRLDRFLISLAWNMTFPNCSQKSLPNTSSDHCLLLYSAATNFKKLVFLKFENFGSLQQNSERLYMKNGVSHRRPLQHYSCISNSQIFKSQSLLGQRRNKKKMKHQIMICRNFLGWIDKVEEIRQTTSLEKWVKAVLKRRHTELAVKEEEMWRQRAKIK